ncbi:MAG: response regulator transcription factor [Saprospiraceae bacterium]|nr:response regulator transcription factor [Saprospiraceae bacterium]
MFLLLFAIPVMVWPGISAPEISVGNFSPQKINLALRRTADLLLRQSGDSTSRIPAVKEVSKGVWQVKLEQPFSYEQLPALLQASLDQHDIRQAYDVTVRRCNDGTIDLGYNYLDFKNKSGVACSGREKPTGCHFIEITFLESAAQSPFYGGLGGILLLILGGMVMFWFFRRQHGSPAVPESDNETDWLEFGNSRIDVNGQVLICNGVRQTLTFREAKLLRLFAANFDRLLEREYILEQVWADEGILVGRSVDVFVSRLRKKLATDLSVGIVVVHGVGYRLESMILV